MWSGFSWLNPAMGLPEHPGRVIRRRDCRLCGGNALKPVLRLASTPPANAFARSAEEARAAPVFPLELHRCDDCQHVQLLDVVDPELLFRDYVYVSGTSPSFVEHFLQLALTMQRHFAGQPGRVLEIGSNDGTLLRQFQALGWEVLGVDPARSIASRAEASGVPTLNGFFDASLAAGIAASQPAFDLVCANNVLAHIDNLCEVVASARDLLAPGGLLVFEVSYWLDVFQRTLFDTIYHEHLDYHSVAPLKCFLERLGLELIEVERIASHGGSIRCIAQHTGGRRTPGSSVAELIETEQRLGITSDHAFAELGTRITGLGARLGGLLRDYRAHGRRIAGFGAPAKATTLAYQFGLDAETLDFIIDDSPLKQGLYSPGLGIPVLAASALDERGPEVLVVLAWTFAQSIIARHADWIARGGTLVVPLPELEIHHV
jgi:SAM-dependent methyltransferase